MAKRSMAIRISASEQAFYVVVGVILAVFTVVTLYPLVFILSASISEPAAVGAGRVTLLPVGFSMAGYQAVFKNKYILSGYYNSFVYTVVGTMLNLLITLPTAFVLSRKELMGRSWINFLFAFTMWFSGGMIPSFLLVRDLGIMNTRWALWLPGIMGVWNMIIARTFISSTIPSDLYEAASIDGCGYFRFFAKVVLPLSGAIIAVLALFYGIGHWNTYFSAMIYLNKRELYPLQIILREVLISNTVDTEMLTGGSLNEVDYNLVEVLKYSLIIVACLPLWAAYPFIQRFFVKGVMIGSIKG